MTRTPEEKLEGLRVYGEIREFIIHQLRHFTRSPVIASEPEYKDTEESFQKNILFELKEIKKEFTRIKKSDLNE